MGLTDKPDFPPLLEPGFQEFELNALRSLCVEPFPLSETRKPIMSGLEDLLRLYHSAGIEGSVWIDGSFVTRKIDPDDADLILQVTWRFVESASEEQHALFSQWQELEFRETHRCHTFFVVTFPEWHEAHGEAQRAAEYWARWFGHSRKGSPKGIAVVSLPLTSA